MGRTLDNAMLNIGMKDIATGINLFVAKANGRGIKRTGRSKYGGCA